jgi:acyl carrier protein
LVVQIIGARALAEKPPHDLLNEDARLANLGIDSLGLILIFIDLASQTGLEFERREGMAPIRTVGDVIEFALDLAAV